MKICILLCGLKRTYDEIKYSLHNNLISILKNKDTEIDSFVHSDKPIEVFNLKGSIISEPNKYENIPIQFSRFIECYQNLVLPFEKKYNKVTTKKDIIVNLSKIFNLEFQ